MRITKNIALSLIIFFLAINTTIAQVLPKADIIITGNVGVSKMKKLEMLVFKEILTGPDSNLNKTYNIPINNCNFAQTVTANSEVNYIQVLGINKAINAQPVMLVPGEEINLASKEDGSIYHQTSALFNCQIELNGLIMSSKKVFNLNMEELEERMTVFSQMLDKIVTGYENKVPESMLELLKTEYYSRYYISLLQGLGNGILRQDLSTKLYAEKTLSSIDLSFKKFVSNVGTSNVRNSISYARYFYELEVLKSRLINDSKDKVDERFEQILSEINRNYKGLLREKIVMIFFLRSFNISNQAIRFLNEQIPTIKDSLYHKILTELKQSKTAGVKAYMFELKDDKGKLRTLKEFEGKVVVCKFWFLGCSGCIQLQEELKPIKKRYETDTNVVFMSINVDSQKNNWLTGIERGIYTDSHDIKLSTYGLGTKHPMLAFYHYYSYPQMLIIGKKGEVITSSPVRPNSERNLKTLIEIIDKNLK